MHNAECYSTTVLQWNNAQYLLPSHEHYAQLLFLQLLLNYTRLLSAAASHNAMLSCSFLGMQLLIDTILGCSLQQLLLLTSPAAPDRQAASHKHYTRLLFTSKQLLLHYTWLLSAAASRDTLLSCSS